jgi:hypothetical protein
MSLEVQSAEPGYSDYIVFVDESGDHGLGSIDPSYPMFVLALCIFRKQDYIDLVCPAVQRFKFKYWGHDSVVLHEHDIRKPSGPYGFLFNPAMRTSFMADLNALMEAAPFTLIASVVRKQDLKDVYTLPGNPYHLSLEFGLERLHKFLEGCGQADRMTHVVVERRGPREDKELELEFRRICDGANFMRKRLNMEIVMSSKASNAPGMQLADLVARPIGTKALRPTSANRAYDILASKFRRSSSGEIKGWGLKSFP